MRIGISYGFTIQAFLTRHSQKCRAHSAHSLEWALQWVYWWKAVFSRRCQNLINFSHRACLLACLLAWWYVCFICWLLLSRQPHNRKALQKLFGGPEPKLIGFASKVTSRWSAFLNCISELHQLFILGHRLWTASTSNSRTKVDKGSWHRVDLAAAHLLMLLLLVHTRTCGRLS